MKKYLLTLFILISFCPMRSNAQTHQDTIRMIRETTRLYDLDFTEEEADSMIGNINNYNFILKGMHRSMLSNDVPFPFAFHPAPAGMNISTKKEKLFWDIPLRTPLPADKNKLAFYSIPQLAALLYTKKMSSVELTQFFLARLKKWGDTLQCVITLTEELAMEQARQADAEMKKGIYRGILHGIPYGLKDLFSVKDTPPPGAPLLTRARCWMLIVMYISNSKKRVPYFAPNYPWDRWLIIISGLEERQKTHGI